MEAARIRGSVALVTGGAQGLGEGIAVDLAKRGAKVVIADVNEEKGEAVARRIGGLFVHCDVSKFPDNQAAVQTAVDNYGGLHIVALNAGVAMGNRMGENFDPDAWARTRAINLDGVVYGANAAYPALRASGRGEIIATASVAGLYPVPSDPAYAATKHAVVGLVRALGARWADKGVHVKGLCPSFADTEMIAGIRDKLIDQGFGVLPVESVVDAFMTTLTRGQPGQCWSVVQGERVQPVPLLELPDSLQGGRTQSSGSATGSRPWRNSPSAAPRRTGNRRFGRR